MALCVASDMLRERDSAVNERKDELVEKGRKNRENKVGAKADAAKVIGFFF